MSQAVQGKGTLIQVETSASSGVYATIPEIGEIQGPNLESDEHEVTSQDTVGLGKEFLPGLVDPGSVSFSINEVITNQYHRRLASDKETLTTRNYKKVWPNGYYRTFIAYVKTYNPTNPANGPQRVQVSLRLTQLPGAITAP